MDRLEDLLKVSSIYVSNKNHESGNDKNVILSPYTQLALSVSKQLDDTENIIGKLPSLVSRKEFSNDPTEEMANISLTFERSIAQIQKGVSRLTQYDTNREEMSNHQRQHFKNILQHIKSRLSNQVQEFKDLLKVHSVNMKLREQRVHQYSGGISINNDQHSHSMYSSTQLSSSSSALPSSRVIQSAAQNYAMFATPTPSIQQQQQYILPLLEPLSTGSVGKTDSNSTPSSSSSNGNSAGTSSSSSNELRRRPNIQNNNNNSVYNPYSQQKLQQSSQYNSAYPFHQSKPPSSSSSQSLLMRNQYANQESFKSTQKVESAITQLGELFVQMSSLVLEQSETILRIEDDVEEGLHNTVEAHASMETVYAITKGNRGMIIKVFLLLIIFILIFLIIF